MFRSQVIVLLLCCVVIVSACSKPTPTRILTRPAPTIAPSTDVPDPSPTPYQTRLPNTIAFAVYGDAVEREAYQKLVEVFEAKNPDTRVELDIIPNQFAYREKIAGDFSVGDPPDVVLLNNRRYGFYGLRNMLAPLGPYLEKSTVLSESDFFSQALEPFRVRGQLMCIPQTASPLVVYYNKEFFDIAKVSYPRADWTWDDFLKTAQQLSHDTNGDGKNDVFGLGTEGDLLRLSPFIWQNDAEIFDNPKRPTRFTFDSPAVKEALQWVVDLQNKHRVVPSPDDEIIESFESRFMNGTIAMFINQRRGVGLYRDNTEFDWDIAPLPRHKMQANVLQAEAYCLPLASGKKDRAWKLIEFASSAEGQTILAQSGRIMPTLRAVAESEAFLQSGDVPKNSRVFIDELAHARSFPVLIQWPQIEEIAGEEIERAFHGYDKLENVLPKAMDRTEVLFKR